MNMRAMFRVEPEELLAMSDGERYELIDGIPREKHMGAASDEIAVTLAAELKTFVRARKRLETRYLGSYKRRPQANVCVARQLESSSRLTWLLTRNNQNRTSPDSCR